MAMQAVIAGLAMMLALLPFAALAADPLPPGVPAISLVNGEVCSQMGNGIMERIVTCIRVNVIWATTNFLLPFSIAMSHIIRMMCTLAIIAFGFNMIIVRQKRVQAEAYVPVIKLGAVVVFTWNFGGMFPVLLSAVDWLVDTVSSFTIYSLPLSCPFAATIWQRMDCALDRLVGGMLPGSALASGFIGFLFGSLFASATGMSIALVGISFLITIIMALFKSVFIYLSAFIAMAMLVIVSPLMVPLILFKVTKAYFEKYLRLILGLLLQPIFLFAYLSMLLAAFDVVVFSGPKSLYATIAGPSAMNPGFRIGNYMMAGGAYVNRNYLPVGVSLDSRQMTERLGVSGMYDSGTWGTLGKWSNDLKRKHETMLNKNIGTEVPVMAVDMLWLAKQRGFCAPNVTGAAASACYTEYVIRITMSMLMASIIAYIFYLMLQFVPYLATAITGDILSTPQMAKGMMDKGLGDFQRRTAPKTADIKEPPKPDIPRPPAAPPVPGK